MCVGVVAAAVWAELCLADGVWRDQASMTRPQFIGRFLLCCASQPGRLTSPPPRRPIDNSDAGSRTEVNPSFRLASGDFIFLFLSLVAADLVVVFRRAGLFGSIPFPSVGVDVKCTLDAC